VADANDKQARKTFPSLPDGTDAFGAAGWVSSVLIKSALEQGWSKADLRRAMLIALIVPMEALDDGDLLVEFAQIRVFSAALVDQFKRDVNDFRSGGDRPQ
jgi:hypothetical protein